MKIEELKALRARLVSNSLTEDDRAALTVILDSHLLLDGAVKEKSGTIRKLLKIIFGAKTEKAHVVFPNVTRAASTQVNLPWSSG